MSRTWSWIVAGMVALIVSAASAAPGRAQQPLPPLQITIGAHGGGAIFTEFLEQRADGGQRELVAKSSPVIGGSISFSRWEASDIRVSADWTGTEIEYQDDSGSTPTSSTRRASPI